MMIKKLSELGLVVFMVNMIKISFITIHPINAGALIIIKSKYSFA